MVAPDSVRGHHRCQGLWMQRCFRLIAPSLVGLAGEVP